MPRENYCRITRGYEPIELAGFCEKVLYLLLVPVYVFQILLMRIKPYRTKDDKNR